jgi:hypothetical protein
VCGTLRQCVLNQRCDLGDSLLCRHGLLRWHRTWCSDEVCSTDEELWSSGRYLLPLKDVFRQSVGF